jgi:acyl phosphate:glycerol-3-phosphate acyltransferase
MTEDMGLLAVGVAAYLVGSIPFAFLIGRLRGVDLRQVGSGNLGAGNLTQSVGLREGVTAAVLDGLKGLVPVAVCGRLGLSPNLVVASGVGAVIGHNWSIFLRGRGGRGLATSAGVIAAFAPALLVWTGGWAVAGWRLGGGFAGFLGWGLLPLFAFAVGEPAHVVSASAALAGLMAARRIQGNPGRPGGLRPSLHRLIWDTDRDTELDASDEVTVQ